MDFLSGKNKNKCGGCGNKINANEPSVEAMKRKFHSKCFACARCGDTITEDFHPVDDKPWCDRCYIKHKAPKCELCKQGIADKRIKTDDGKVYHEACIQKATQGNCDGCGKSIGLTEPVTEALGKSYHQGCFVCGQCKGELPSQFSVDKSGTPLCSNCSTNKKKMSDDSYVERRSESPVFEGERLSETVEVRKIDDDHARRGSATETGSETMVRTSSANELNELGNEGKKHMENTQTYVRDSAGGDDTRKGSLGGMQHNEQQQHQVLDGGWFGMPTYRRTNLRMVEKDDHCNVCGDAITTGGKVSVRGLNFHEDCFENVRVGECSGCHEKIRLTDESVSVPKIQRDWHKQCLNCGLCKGPLHSGAFQLYNDIPTCDTCYIKSLAPKCSGCDQPVGGSQLKAMQKIWHPDCFNCDVCREPLYRSGQEYFNVEGRPMCLRDVQAANIKVM
ncbi:hypothetical protein RvY_01241 [Ramazzottius varieornatus]|uniref:LIM zinc-binding domain-containing protein n=1 Tax=Ramazzottius varieornatus TaxID=947166 RepID=A0A1D1UJ62_RAMVA|nr:hypothetical protein RvY_01241 [Ramazzottius varieornatus]